MADVKPVWNKDFPPEKPPKYPDGITDAEAAKILADAGIKNMNLTDVNVLFKALGMEQYAEKFDDEGYDDPSAWSSMQETILEFCDEAEMKHGHKLKVKYWLAGKIVVTGETEWMGVTPYHGEIVKSVARPAVAA